MPHIFFFIIGKNLDNRRRVEHDDIPRFTMQELQSLLASYFCSKNMIMEYRTLRVIEVNVPWFDDDFVKFMQQSVSIHYTGAVDYYFTSNRTDVKLAIEDFMKKIGTDGNFHQLIHQISDSAETFSIDRVFHTMPIDENIDQTIKVKLGAMIDSKKGLSVDLDQPDKKIRVIISTTREAPHYIVIALSCTGHYHKVRGFKARYARHRPAFEIGTMNPPLTSLMVNFCLPCRKIQNWYLDPFCGTGGIMIEFTDRNLLPCIGMDVDASKVRGCLKNVRHYSDACAIGHHLLQASIFKDPFRPGFNSPQGPIIVTDPPYGKLESLRDVELEKYVLHILKLGNRISTMCFAIPEDKLNSIKEIIAETYPNAGIKQFLLEQHPGFTRACVLVQKKTR